MPLIEIIAVVFSLLCTWLAVKRHVLNWPTGIIGVTFYLILFYQVKLYADMLLQIVFIVQGIYGWYNWKINKTAEEELQVNYLTSCYRFIYGIGILLFAATWAYVLVNFTDASTPYIDALVSTISLAANWLMAKKKTDNWILWIVADVIYVFLFWYKGLTISSALYIVFLILAIKGLIDWNKKSHTKEVSF